MITLMIMITLTINIDDDNNVGDNIDIIEKEREDFISLLQAQK